MVYDRKKYVCGEVTVNTKSMNAHQQKGRGPGKGERGDETVEKKQRGKRKGVAGTWVPENA